MRFAPHRRRSALLALVAALWTTVALPAWHQWGHRPNHRHGLDGAIRFATEDPVASLVWEPSPAHVDDVHRSFDEDAAAIGLFDVLHDGAGALAEVDCTLARYTLARCDEELAEPDLASAHAAGHHTFADELVARAPHHHPSDASESSSGGHDAQGAAHFALAFVGAACLTPTPPAGLIRPLTPHAPTSAPLDRTPDVFRNRGPPPTTI